MSDGSGKELHILLPRLLWHKATWRSSLHLVSDFGPKHRQIPQALTTAVSSPPSKSESQGSWFWAECSLFCSVLKCTGIACLSLAEWDHTIFKFLFVPLATLVLSSSKKEAKSALSAVLVSHGSQRFPFPQPGGLLPGEGCGNQRISTCTNITVRTEPCLAGF